MNITKAYKYKNNGFIYAGSTVPNGAEILEIMDILNAKKGFTLVRISDNEEIGNSLWLRNGDVKENYREEKEEEDAE